jgi:hypothetical protein
MIELAKISQCTPGKRKMNWKLNINIKPKKKCNFVLLKRPTTHLTSVWLIIFIKI